MTLQSSDANSIVALAVERDGNADLTHPMAYSAYSIGRNGSDGPDPSSISKAGRSKQVLGSQTMELASLSCRRFTRRRSVSNACVRARMSDSSKTAACGLATLYGPFGTGYYAEYLCTCVVKSTLCLPCHPEDLETHVFSRPYVIEFEH